MLLFHAHFSAHGELIVTSNPQINEAKWKMKHLSDSPDRDLELCGQQIRNCTQNIRNKE